jgi:type IX secretion system PorP/SprF family membrane protein
MLTNEEIGVNGDLRISGMASYRLEQREGSFQFGLGAGLGISQSRWSEVITDEQDDILFQGSDRSLLRPLFSTGVFYETKSWYAGYSIPSLLSHSYVNDEKLRTYFAPGQIEHNLTAGWAKSIGRGLVLKPSFLLRTIPNAAIQMDINANLIFQDRLWTGLSLRMDRSIVAMLEYQINHQFRIGYAYDYGLSKLYSYSIGSHELMLIWQKKRRSVARNPRYF